MQLYWLSIVSNVFVWWLQRFWLVDFAISALLKSYSVSLELHCDSSSHLGKPRLLWIWVIIARMSLKIAGMWLKINYVAKVFVQGPRLPTIELRVASRLLDFVLRWVLLVLLLLQQNSVLSSARASKFFDNSSLLVRFRCMGVRSNLPLYAGDQPACALHAQTNYCIKPACVEWLSLNSLVHRQPMLYIISWCIIWYLHQAYTMHV